MHQNLPEIYYVPVAPQQHNAPQVHKDLTDGLDLPTIARQFMDANQRPQAFLWHCAQSTMKPTRATGVNTWNC